MSIVRGAVNRPILTSIVYLAVLVIGAVAFSRLPIDLMPEVTYLTISVVTSYGNVGPEEMEELVTRPIEESLAAVQGVEEITSSSTEGRSMVRVSFTWGTDLDVASNDIRDRIDRVLGRLPEDIDRPMIRKFDISAFPILQLGASSDMSPLDLRRIMDNQIKYRIERAPGVAAADIFGGLVREIHVDLHASKLKALGLSTDSIINAIGSENVNIPAGLYNKGNLKVLVRTQGEYQSLEDIRNTVITNRNGTTLRIKDVADVKDSWQEVTRIDRINGNPGLRVSINKQSGVNTVKVVDAVREELKRIKRDYPQIDIVPLVDTSIYIKQSINNLGHAAILGGILAIIVLFLFLRNISSTAIIATAVPISMIATFGLIYFGGFTLNLMTFGGLTLGIGMLMDNAIVVLENIFRYREYGHSPLKSAVEGTSEVWSAIVAGTMTHIVVFLPVIFMQGMSGILFQQMAYVVVFSFLCSLIVAVTLVPMLTSRFLRYESVKTKNPDSKLQKVYDLSEQTFKNIETKYGLTINWALSNRKKVVLFSAALFIVSVFLVRFIGVELMPQADESQVSVNIEMAVGSRLEIVNEATQMVENILKREVPETISVLSQVGSGGAPHTAGITVNLVPISKRKRSSEEIANVLRKKLSGIPGVTIRTRAGQGLFLLRLGTQTTDNISVEVRGYDLQIAQELAKKVDQVVKTVPGITDTKISREEGSPEEIIQIDRQKAADLGLTVTRIGNALQTAVGGTQSSYFRDGGKEYWILVRLSEEERKRLTDFLDLTIINNRGEPVILRNVVNAIPRQGPVRIERKDQERIITINANFTKRDMGSVISDIRKKLLDLPIPKDFAILFGGDYEEQQKAFRQLMFAFFLAIIFIYMVMAAQFESFRDPFIILFSIPMALIGITVTLILTGTIFSMQAFIGCIMLAGIVTNNSILLVHYTNLLRRRDGMEMKEAIKLAGIRRLRPILMTTATTTLGLLPLAFGLGEGGEAQAPLARVVVGGLLSSTLITLVLVPVVYSIFEQKLKTVTKIADTDE